MNKRFVLLATLLVAAGAALLVSGPARSQGLAGASVVDCRDGRVAIPSLPYRIDACGSYFLRACLVGAAGADGITIDADDVTLDLNGFTLLGVAGSGDGVVVAAGRRNVSVIGGGLRDWGGAGVRADGARGARLAELHARDNAGPGLVLGQGVLARCTATDNGGDGLAAGFGSTLESCTANGNGGIGIVLFPGGTATGAVVRDSAARANSLGGIQAGDGCVITGCAASHNGAFGIQAGPVSVIADCTSAYNAGAGIQAGDALVRGNASRGNGALDLDAPGSTVVENH